MAIKKKEFADRMAENGGMTKKAAYKAVDVFIETLMDYLSEGEKVMFNNFGRFEMKTLEGRKGRLPFGGECIIPEHKKMKFYPSRELSKKIEEMQREEE